MVHKTLLQALCATTAVVAVPAGAAQAQATVELNLPAQDLGKSLRAVAQATNSNVAFDPAVTNGKTAPRIQGRYSAGAAVQRLLAGSGLTARSTGTGSIIVSAPQGNVPGAVEVAAGPSSSGETASPGGEGASAEGQEGISEILVVGSRSQNVDIRRTEDDAQPYVVFNKEEIEKSGAGNLEEFLNRRLPMNSQRGMEAQVQPSPALLGSIPETASISSINLRGLGAQQTLILIDGRRAPQTIRQGFTSVFGQADINGIPLATIERVEILPSTAGGIYGGSAVGGVINIVRKRDYRGITIDANYSAPFHGGGETWRLAVGGGVSLEQGKTQISFSASRSDANPFYLGDNNLWREGRELFARNDPRRAVFAAGAPNICSGQFSCLVSAPLVLDNGTSLGSPVASIPYGYPGLAGSGGNTAPLLASAGRYNTDLPMGSLGEQYTLINNPRVTSANVNIRRAFGRSVDLFADFDWADNQGRSSIAGSASNAVAVAGSSPTNPFQQTVLIFPNYPALDGERNSGFSSLSATAGAIIRAGGGWAGSVEYDWSRARSDYETRQPFVNNTALAAAANSGAVDLFRDLRAHPVNLSPYVRDQIFDARYDLIQKIASVRASGPLVSLWGGPVTMTTLLENRVERRPEIRSLSYGGNSSNATYIPALSQKILSAYLEVNVPIVSGRNSADLIEKLELRASVRHDRYRTEASSPGSLQVFSPDPTVPAVLPAVLPPFVIDEKKYNSTNFTASLLWEPVPDLAFRTSFATGFLPPTISQLQPNGPNPISPSPSLTDPRRANEIIGSRLPAQSGANVLQHVVPEQSRSLAVGAILKPSFLPGVRFSIDYVRIKKSQEITTVSRATLLANEDLFPGRITRGPNQPGDAPGWPGPITFIDTGFINLAASQVSNVDLQLDIDIGHARLGNFHLYSVATRALKFQRQLAVGSARFDSVGMLDGPLKWRGNIGLDWSLGKWSAGWNAQYYDDYSITFADPAQASNGAFNVNVQGSARIPSQTYHDLRAGYRFDRSISDLLDQAEVTVVVQNAFDKRPPAVAALLSGYSGYGDPRLRRFTLNIRKPISWK